jgi:chromosome segregation ATPase
MNEEREKEIQNLKNQILSEKENNEKLTTKIKELKDEYDQKISSLNEKINQKDLEINKIKEDMQFSSKSSQDLMNKHKEEIERIKFSNTLTINELKLKHENEISSLKIENMKIKENLDKAKEMENLLHKLKLQLQQKSSQEIELSEKEEKFKKMHMDAVNKLKFEFQNSIKALQQKNENYENEIRELENFIISRPSRDEDLEQIEELKQALEMKMREIEELKEIINNNNKKIKLLNSKNKGPKYTNASYGMIFSKKIND